MATLGGLIGLIARLLDSRRLAQGSLHRSSRTALRCFGGTHATKKPCCILAASVFAPFNAKLVPDALRPVAPPLAAVLMDELTAWHRCRSAAAEDAASWLRVATVQIAVKTGLLIGWLCPDLRVAPGWVADALRGEAPAAVFRRQVEPYPTDQVLVKKLGASKGSVTRWFTRGERPSALRLDDLATYFSRALKRPKRDVHAELYWRYVLRDVASLLASRDEAKLARAALVLVQRWAERAATHEDPGRLAFLGLFEPRARCDARRRDRDGPC